MAASRTPQQPTGNQRYACTELASSLRSRAFISSRPASKTATQVTQAAERRSSSHPEPGQHPPNAKAQARRSRPSRKRHSSPAAVECLAPEQLTAAIRACGSTADLLALHRRHGDSFNHIHACAALHRLADVATLPSGADHSPADPRPSPDPQPLEPSAPTDNRADGTPITTGPQLTGRLRVRQGQQVSETAAYVGFLPASAVAAGSTDPSYPQQQRLRSHSEASTSAPSPLPQVVPDDEQIVALGSTLAAILHRSCGDMDGRGVATAASALSRLRYEHVELLGQLERRSLELLRGQRKTAVAEVEAGAGTVGVSSSGSKSAGKGPTVSYNMSVGGKGDSGHTDNEGGVAPAAAAAAAKAAVSQPPGKVKKRLKSSGSHLEFQTRGGVGGGVVDGGSGATQLTEADMGAVHCSMSSATNSPVGTSLEGGRDPAAGSGRPDLSASVVETSSATMTQQALGAGQAVRCSSGHGSGLLLGGHQHAPGLGHGPHPQKQEGSRKSDSQPLQHKQVVTQKQQEHRSREQEGSSDHRPALPPSSCGEGLNPDELYALVTAFGSLTHTTSRKWQATVLAAVRPHLTVYATPRLSEAPARLPTLLCSLLNTGARPSNPWLQAACAAVRPHLSSYSARQLRSLMDGLAALQHRPDDPWVSEYLAASEAALAAWGPEDLEVLLTGLAKLGWRPGEGWMAAFYERSTELVVTAGGVTAAQASTLLSTLSSLSLRPSSEWINTLLISTRRGLFDASAAQFTQHLTALSALRFRPPEPWLQHYYAASFQRLPFHTPQQAVDAITALAALGVSPQPTWLQEVGRQLGGKLGLLPGGQQAAALGALVELGYKPAAGWLAGYEKASNGRLAGCSVRELCGALAALAKVDFKPHASWLYSFIMAAYSKLDAFDAAQLALVFESLPALTPHGSWLDEIIQICAAESAMRSMVPAAAAAREVTSSSATKPSLASSAFTSSPAAASSSSSFTTSAIAAGASILGSVGASVGAASTPTSTPTPTVAGVSGPAGRPQQVHISRMAAASARSIRERGTVHSLPEPLQWASMKVLRGSQRHQQQRRMGEQQLVRELQQFAARTPRVSEADALLQQVMGKSGWQPQPQGVSHVGGRWDERAVEVARQLAGGVGAVAGGAGSPGRSTTSSLGPSSSAVETTPTAAGAAAVAAMAVGVVEGAAEGASMTATQQDAVVAPSGGLFTNGAVTMGTIYDYHPDVPVEEGNGDGVDRLDTAAGLGEGELAVEYESAGDAAAAADALELPSAVAVNTQAVGVLKSSEAEAESQPFARAVGRSTQLDIGRVRVVVDGGPITIAPGPLPIESGLVSMEPTPYIGLSRGSLAVGPGDGDDDNADLLTVMSNGTENGAPLQLSVVPSVVTAPVGALSAATTRTAVANANGVMQPMGQARRNGSIDDRSREGRPPGASSGSSDGDGGSDTGDGSNGGGGAGGGGRSGRDVGPSEPPPIIRLRGPVGDAIDREGGGVVLLPPPTARAPAAAGLALASVQTYDPMGSAMSGATRDAMTNGMLSVAAPTIGGVPPASANDPVLPFHGTALTLPPPPQQSLPAASTASLTTQPNSLIQANRAVQYLDSASLSRLISTPDDPPGPDFSSCQMHKEKAPVRARVRRVSGSARLRWATGPLPSPSA